MLLDQSQSAISPEVLLDMHTSEATILAVSHNSIHTISALNRVTLYLHGEEPCWELKSLPDKGKVTRCLQIFSFPSTNSWCYNCTGMHFYDWHFIQRARTNTLPTNEVKSRFSNGNSPTCRNCHSPDNVETLPHIICHCCQNMPSITKRRDSVFQKLTNAIQRDTYTVDQVVPGAPHNNHPDLVITNNNKITIINITCPIENDDSALTSAARKKYNYLVDHFRSLNIQAKLFGFVVKDILI